MWLLLIVDARSNNWLLEKSEGKEKERKKRRIQEGKFPLIFIWWEQRRQWNEIEFFFFCIVPAWMVTWRTRNKKETATTGWAPESGGGKVMITNTSVYLQTTAQSYPVQDLRVHNVQVSNTLWTYSFGFLVPNFNSSLSLKKRRACWTSSNVADKSG